MKMVAPPGLPPTPGEELVSFLYNRILFVWFPTHLETTFDVKFSHIYRGVNQKFSAKDPHDFDTDPGIRIRKNTDLEPDPGHEHFCNI